jgi:hypothetical protein
MANLDHYKEAKEYYTSKASEVNRSLAFAGLAIIWIFRKSNHDTSVILLDTIPDGLEFSLIMLVLALALDMLHYVVGSVIWSIFYRVKEKLVKTKKIKNDGIEANSILPNTIHVFFVLKILANVLGFVSLLKFLICIL